MVPDKRPKKKKRKKRRKERRRRERGLKDRWRLQRMIKTSQFFPFRFPLTRIRACFSVRTSPPFLSAEKTFHRLFYLLYLIPPLSSSSPSSSPLPRCVLFLFRLAFSLPHPSPLSPFFRLAFSLSPSPPPPLFFFKSIRTLCVRWIQRRASRNFFPLTIFPILVLLLVLPPTPRWRAARCRISVTLFRALISRYISPVYVERNTESPDIQVTRRFLFFSFFPSCTIFITPALTLIR